MEYEEFVPTSVEGRDELRVVVADKTTMNTFIPTPIFLNVPSAIIPEGTNHACFVKNTKHRECLQLYIDQNLQKDVFYCQKCQKCFNNPHENLEQHFKVAHPKKKKVKKGKKRGAAKKNPCQTLPVPKMQNEEKQPQNFENYILGKMLGKGAFGSVFKGFDTDTGKPVAIKAIPLNNKNEIASVQSEIEIMKNLNNNHIVRYIGSHKTNDFLYIVMEFAEQGSLQSTQERFGNFTERLSAQYIQQILLGLQYLHSQYIIHHDIKEANILLINNVPKLSDFGISINLNSGFTSQNEMQCSPYWTAPEVINDNIVSYASDIWSLGITAIEMYTGSPPYFDLSPIPAMYKIAQSNETPLPDNISPEFRDFLQCCLNRDKDFRATVDELLEHRWIKKNMEDDDSDNDNIEYVHRKSIIPTIDKGKSKLSQELDQFAESLSSDHLFSSDSNDDGASSNGKTSMPKLPSDNFDFMESDSDGSMEFEDNDGKLSILKPVNNNNITVSPGILDHLSDDENIVQHKEKEVADLDDFAENDDLDFDDFGEDTSGEPKLIPLQLAPKMPAKSFGSGDVGSDDSDLFEGDGNLTIALPTTQAAPVDTMAQLDDIFDDDDDDIQQERERQNQLMKSTINEIDRLPTLCSNSKRFDDFKASCKNLASTFENEPFIKTNLTDYHGVIPIVTILQSRNQDLLEYSLPFIIIAISDQTDTQNMLCLLGVLPFLFEYSIDPSYSKQIQEMSLKILHNFCISMKKPLQMFISAGGLLKLERILEDFSYEERPILTKYVIEIIDAVFSFRSSTPKSCFARIIAQSNLVSLLGKRFVEITNDDQLMEVLCRIFEVFSNGDTVVKYKMAEKDFIDNIFTKARYNPENPELNDWDLNKVINTMNNLAIDKAVAPKLWKTNLVTRLIEHLEVVKTIKVNDHIKMNIMQNTCFSAIFHLSLVLTNEHLPQIMPLIPMLPLIIDKMQSVKELATMLFLEIINNHSNNEEVRKTLQENEGLQTLFSLLEKNPHKEQILTSFDIWASHDTSVIEKYLIEHIEEFTLITINMFTNDPINSQTQYANELLMICDRCPKLTKEFSNTNLVKEIINKLGLQVYESVPELRKSFVSIILTIVLSSNDKQKISEECDLISTANNLLKNDPSLLVKNLAQQILQILEPES